MKNGQKLKLGDAHGTPGTYSRSTNHQSLGMPPAPSCSSSSISGRLSNTMFLFIHAISAISWSVRCLSLQYCVVCFVFLNKIVDPSKVCSGERHALLSLSRTL